MLRATNTLFLAILATLTLGLCSAHAQVSYKADAPMVVEPGQQFRVSFILTNATWSSFNEPQFKNATKLAGPTPSTKIHNELINGKQKDVTTHALTYTLTAPSKGNIQVSATTIRGTSNTTSATTTYSTQAFTIEINSASTTTPKIMALEVPPMNTNNVRLHLTLADGPYYKGVPIKAIATIHTEQSIWRYDSVQLNNFENFEVIFVQNPPSPFTLTKSGYKSRVYFMHLTPIHSGQLTTGTITLYPVFRTNITPKGTYTKELAPQNRLCEFTMSCTSNSVTLKARDKR